MIQPLLKDEALLADIASVSKDDERLQIWWLGQSGFLLKQAGATLLFDPYLSDSLTKKYAATDKPHLRMTELCVDPARLAGIPLVTASHIHTDHLDAETLVPLAKSNPGYTLVLPAAIVSEAKQRLADAEITLAGLDEKETLDGEWKITGIAAAHNDVKRDEQGRCHFLGFIAQRGGFTIYHSGDTLMHDGLLPALREFGPIDLMLLPINGNKPERRVAGNLNGTEAAELAKACGARLVVPCHYDMFTFNTVTPDEFVQACERLGQKHEVMLCGGRVTMERA
ncbi:MBL fold metallo-hydrolase [Brevifollis gellanilyticus]|uniref:MBL fold metallo-hydrolase n=1 Tax=Brevifollis gellanilyticus TaxID=748831 RepID=A0A512MBY3_9BACT|nr:MBL fold metallo-hydrolase [Brevifollis gellanilyticus]GEP44244.1 MBL fold metallo-hydrolase [Brevifollis gellanilyticus]